QNQTAHYRQLFFHYYRIVKEPVPSAGNPARHVYISVYTRLGTFKVPRPDFRTFFPGLTKMPPSLSRGSFTISLENRQRNHLAAAGFIPGGIVAIFVSRF